MTEGLWTECLSITSSGLVLGLNGSFEHKTTSLTTAGSRKDPTTTTQILTRYPWQWQRHQRLPTETKSKHEKSLSVNETVFSNFSWRTVESYSFTSNVVGSLSRVHSYCLSSRSLVVGRKRCRSSPLVSKGVCRYLLLSHELQIKNSLTYSSLVLDQV